MLGGRCRRAIWPARGRRRSTRARSRASSTAHGRSRPHNGVYHVSDDGHAVVHGNYTIKGNKISLKDTGGPAKCPGTGVYKFKVSGKSLKFTLVSDKNAACIGRRGVLTAGTFKKAG